MFAAPSLPPGPHYVVPDRRFTFTVDVSGDGYPLDKSNHGMEVVLRGLNTPRLYSSAKYCYVLFSGSVLESDASVKNYADNVCGRV